jgi:hypothetical protein
MKSEGQVGGRGRECVSKRCTQWVSRVEKRGSACCFRRQPPLFLGLSATLGVVESFRERGERASERERECERDGDRGRWAGVGVWVWREFSTNFFSLFFLCVQVAGQELVQETRRGGWDKSSRHRRRPSHRHKLITRQTH